MPTRKTQRQKEIMRLITDAALRGHWLDINELIDQLHHLGSKQAVQCSLRILEQEDDLVREYAIRRSKKRCILVPTKQGFDKYRNGTPLPSWMSSSGSGTSFGSASLSPTPSGGIIPGS